MSLDLSLDNKKIVIMAAAFCVLFILAFMGGWISGAKKTQTKGLMPPAGADQPKPKAAQSTASVENQKSDLAQKKVDLEQKIPLTSLQKKAPPSQTGEKAPPADQKPAGDKAAQEGATGDKAAPEGGGAAKTASPQDAAKTDATPKKAEPEETAEEEIPIVYSVQVGSFVAKIKADNMVEQLKARGQESSILNQQDSWGRRWYTVQIGDFPDYEVASETAKQFTKKKKIVAVVQPLDMFVLKAMKAEPSTEEEAGTSAAKKEEAPPEKGEAPLQGVAQDTPQAQTKTEQPQGNVKVNSN